MIPTEVVTIAEILGLRYKGSEAEWEQYIDVAWDIYNSLYQ